MNTNENVFSDPTRKRAYNRRLFTVVAPRYDLVTRILSFGRDRAWKRYLVANLPAAGMSRGRDDTPSVSGSVRESRTPAAPEKPLVLDLACGTGDLTFALAQRYPHAEVVGLDLNPEMLAIARRRRDGARLRSGQVSPAPRPEKRRFGIPQPVMAQATYTRPDKAHAEHTPPAKPPPTNASPAKPQPALGHPAPTPADDLIPSFREGDMQDLPFPDDSVSVVTGAYALRNAPDLAATLAEIRRVLRPGGALAVLEFSHSARRGLCALQLGLLRFWGRLWGRVLHRDPDVYGYIADSLAVFPDLDSFKRMLRRAGFSRVSARRYMFGLLAVTRAVG